MADFRLDPRLAADSLAMAELELCSLRLMNDRRFPWLLLIPRRTDCIEILDLPTADRDQLWAEILAISDLLKQLTNPDKLNVAALGNQVSQLHVHIIARFGTDVAWPAPVWGVGQMQPWGSEAEGLIQSLCARLIQPKDPP